MSDVQLYLTPCDNPLLRHYFGLTVLERVPEETYRGHLDEGYRDPIRLWGIPHHKGRRYGNMSAGDFVLFYTDDGQYGYAAEIIGKEANQGLIRAVETRLPHPGSDSSPPTQWEHCIYLDRPFPVSIDSRTLHDYAGHSRARPFDFTRLNSRGREAIREEYGDVGSYLRSHGTASEGHDLPPDTGSIDGFESIEGVASQVSEETGSTSSTIDEDVSKLHRRGVSLPTIYRVVGAKHGSDRRSSVLAVDAVGVVRGGRLLAAGYESIRDLADASVRELTAVPEISERTARVINEHANELIGGQSTASEIASDVGDTEYDVEKTLRAVAPTGVSRSEARSIVTRLHTRPSILDLPGLQRSAAYHLIDHGYATPERIANATPEELTEVPRIGERNVKTIQASAVELLEQEGSDTDGSLPRTKRLSDLEDWEMDRVSEMLGVDDVGSLDHEDWDAVLSDFFNELVHSPFDIRLNSESGSG